MQWLPLSPVPRPVRPSTLSSHIQQHQSSPFRSKKFGYGGKFDGDGEPGEVLRRQSSSLSEEYGTLGNHRGLLEAGVQSVLGAFQDACSSRTHSKSPLSPTASASPCSSTNGTSWPSAAGNAFALSQGESSGGRWLHRQTSANGLELGDLYMQSFGDSTAEGRRLYLCRSMSDLESETWSKCTAEGLCFSPKCSVSQRSRDIAMIGSGRRAARGGAAENGQIFAADLELHGCTKGGAGTSVQVSGRCQAIAERESWRSWSELRMPLCV